MTVVGKAGGWTATFALTADVAPGASVGHPIDLVLALHNVSGRPQTVWTFDYLHPESRFILWVFRGHDPVPLTTAGGEVQSRHEYKHDLIDENGPLESVPPGTVKALHVDLASLFRIDSSGEYTVVAEECPVSDGNDPCRPAFAAKCEFAVVP